MAKHWDFANLLGAFDESLNILIRHIEGGFPDRALMRAKEMQKAVRKIMAHIGYKDNHIARDL